MTVSFDAPLAGLFGFFSDHRRHFSPKSKILVACSGGPDSVCLVWALRSLYDRLPFEFHIGHVNHALRGRSSEEDAVFVRGLANKVGWPFHVVRRPIRREESGNLEERARDQRYAALARMADQADCVAVLTAHTEDDQVETVLMNLARGTGLDGLSGMPALRALGSTDVLLGRPFLTVSKAELLKWLESFKFRFRLDQTNKDHELLRNWFRRNLLPLLERRVPGFGRRVSRLSVIAADEKRYWDGICDALAARLLKVYKGGRLLDLKGLLRYSAPVQRRFLRRVIGGDLLTFDAIERLRRWMASPPTNGRVFQLKKGWTLERLSKSKGSPSAQLLWLRETPAKKDKNRT